MLKILTRSAVLGLALAVIPSRGASAQVVVNAACNPVVSTCDRIDFAFNTATTGEFFNIVIRTSDPNFRFRDDNTDPVGGLPFQNADLYDVDNDEPLVWPGAIDPFGAGQQWSAFPFSLPTQLTGNFILSLYFEQVGTLASGTFSFEVEGTSAAGGPITGSGQVSVLAGPPPTVVPEPATVLLLASGLAGLGVVGARRRRTNVAA